MIGWAVLDGLGGFGVLGGLGVAAAAGLGVLGGLGVAAAAAAAFIKSLIFVISSITSLTS